MTKKQSNKRPCNQEKSQLAKVLYQRLGADIYMFTELEGEIYTSRMKAEEKANISEEDFPDMSDFFDLQRHKADQAA